MIRDKINDKLAAEIASRGETRTILLALKLIERKLLNKPVNKNRFVI